MSTSWPQPTKSVDLTQEDKDDTIVEAEKNVSDVRLLLAVWTTTSRPVDRLVMRDPQNSNRSRGYGHITCEKPRMLEN